MRNLVTAAAILATLVSCTPQQLGDAGDDDAPLVDGSPLVIDSGGGIADARLSVDLPLNCVDYTRVDTEASGARTEYTSRWATFEDIGPGDDFIVTYCYPAEANPWNPACGVNLTCTGDLVPSGQVCTSGRSSGQFFGGHLAVQCGYTYKVYDSAGTLTSQSTATNNVSVTKL